MAYIGNLKGPRESIIVDRLGHEYFGITPKQLAEEVEWYEDEERRGEITPVRQDEALRYYIEFTAPSRRTQRYYLDEHGHTLEGEVRLWPPGADSVEVKRAT